MCGIVGLLDSGNGFFHSDTQLLFGMMLLNSFRGAHSTGVMGLSKDGKADVVKALHDPYQWAQWQLSSDFVKRMPIRYWAVVGHGRLATQGKVNVRNAHPFIHKHITLVHNGTIRNFAELQKEYNTNFDVDSHLMCWMIAEVGIKETVEKINGAFTFVYFDSNNNTVNIIRNSERPLHLALNGFEDRIMISSTRDVLKWAEAKDSRVMKVMGEVPVNLLHTFKVENRKFEKEIVSIAKKYTTTHYGAGYGHGYGYESEWGSESDYLPAVKSTTPAVGFLPPATTKKNVTDSENLYISGVHYRKGSLVPFTLEDYISATNADTKEAFLMVSGLHLRDNKVEIAAHFKGTDTDFLSNFSDSDKDFKMMGKLISWLALPEESEYEFRLFLEDIKPMVKKRNEEELPRKEDSKSGATESTEATNSNDVSVANSDPKVVDINEARGQVQCADGQVFGIKRFKNFAMMGCKLCKTRPLLVEAIECIISYDPLTRGHSLYCGACLKAHDHDLNNLKAATIQ